MTKFIIEENDFGMRITIFAIENIESPTECKSIFFHPDTRLLDRQAIDPYGDTSKLKPLLSLPRRMADDLFSEILKNRDKLNIKPKEESFTQGKLSAVQDHLKDMQDIVKKLLKM